MSNNLRTESITVSSILISNICHDLISPINAIMAGLELLDEEEDTDSREQYLKLINTSVQTASTRLQFIRLAFGRTLSSNANCKMNEIHDLATRYLNEEKIELNWHIPDIEVPNKFVRVLLNMLLLSIYCNTSNNTLSVTMSGTPVLPYFKVISSGIEPNLDPVLKEFFESKEVNFNDILQTQPYFQKLLAVTNNVNLKLEETDNTISISMIHR